MSETTQAVAPAVWLVDKPAGPTSHDIVARVRRRLGRGVRVGHAGTLDPFATGLLLVLVGRATRLAQYLTGLDKTYRATVRLGARSASGDPEGPVEVVGPPPGPSAVEAALASLVGTQRQRVPALSAVKVDGERLYRRTRRGEDVDLPEREVTVHEARLLGYEAGSGLAEVEVRCSKGTYLRQLAADLGERSGSAGYCMALRRLRVGELSVDDAVDPDAVGPEGGMEPARALAHLPRRDLAMAEAEAVRHGRPVAADGPPAEGPVVLVHEGRMVAVGRGDGARLRPVAVIA